MEETPKMLVVDIDSDLARLAQQTFRGTFEVVPVSNREEALRKANSEMPALVLLGSLESHTAYIEFCKELKETSTTKDIPLLVVDLPLDQYCRRPGWRKSEGLQMEADGYVPRPIEQVRLREAVASWSSANGQLFKMAQLERRLE